MLTIPAGETVSLGLSRAPVGVCDARWANRPVLVFREDVERNAIGANGELGQLGEFIG